jgi:hypothetical protein
MCGAEKSRHSSVSVVFRLLAGQPRSHNLISGRGTKFISSPQLPQTGSGAHEQPPLHRGSVTRIKRPEREGDASPQLYLGPVTFSWRVAYLSARTILTLGKAGGVRKMEQMCNLVDRYRRFGRTCCHNPEDGEARSKLCLHFDHED